MSRPGAHPTRTRICQTKGCPRSPVARFRLRTVTKWYCWRCGDRWLARFKTEP
jgi:hypothetical protein